MGSLLATLFNARKKHEPPADIKSALLNYLHTHHIDIPINVNEFIDGAVDALYKTSDSNTTDLEGIIFSLRSILALANLEHKIENIDENAFKLAVTFGDTYAAMLYLEAQQFSLSDACLFSLPVNAIKKDQLLKWGALKKWQKFSKTHMAYTWYQEIWSKATEIEGLITMDAKNYHSQKKRERPDIGYGVVTDEKQREIDRLEQAITAHKKKHRKLTDLKVKKDPLSSEDNKFLNTSSHSTLAI